MTDVVNLGSARIEKTRDNKDWNVRECLVKAIADIDAGVESPTSVMILLLEDHPDDSFSTSWYAANIRGHRMVFLTEYIKSQIIQEMQGS